MASTILLLTHSPLLRGMLTTQLAGEGFDIHTPEMSEAIAEHLHSLKPSLVILDMPMPDHNGAELAAWLCVWRKIPLLILTAPETSDEVRDQFRGAHVLAKPFTLDRLLGKIAEASGETRGTSVA